MMPLSLRLLSIVYAVVSGASAAPVVILLWRLTAASQPGDGHRLIRIFILIAAMIWIGFGRVLYLANRNFEPDASNSRRGAAPPPS